MSQGEFRAPPRHMGKWSDRARPGDLSFEEHFALKAEKSLGLIWYVDPESRWPVWAQLLGLWIKTKIFRRPLP